MSGSLDSALLARQAVIVDVAKMFLLLGIPDARLDVIVRSPGDSQATIARNENILFDIDAAMPMSWFRERFARIGDNRVDEEMSAASLSNAAAFLGRRARDISRIDRIEFIVSRLLTRELPDGQLEALPPGEFFELLDQLAISAHADADTREKAVKFCLSVAQRLQEATSIESLLAGGAYLELQGYKKSLREQRLDPAILSACVLVSVAITNRLVRLAAVEGLGQRALLARVASTEISAESILSAVEETEAVPVPQTSPKPARQRDDPRVRLAAACVASVVAWILSAPGGPSAIQEEIPQERCGTISLVLQSATISDGSPPRLLVGRVHPTKWAALKPDERRRAAEALVRGAREEQAATALFYSGERLVALIEDGEVTWID
jgi:hypothetical protein